MARAGDAEALRESVERVDEVRSGHRAEGGDDESDADRAAAFLRRGEARVAAYWPGMLASALHRPSYAQPTAPDASYTLALPIARGRSSVG